MLRKTDLFAIFAIFVIVFCGCLWVQDLERRAAQAGEPVGDVPRLNLAPKEPLKEPARGFGKARLSADAYARRHGYERAKGKMAALPGGYVRRPETISISGSATLCVRANSQDGPIETFPGNSVGFSGRGIAAKSWPTPGGLYELFVYTYGTGIPGDPTYDYLHTDCQLLEHFYTSDRYAWSQSYDVGFTYSGMILGARYSIDEHTNGGPDFSYRHGRLEHAWFVDENTVFTLTGLGFEYSWNPYPGGIQELGTWVTGAAFAGSVINPQGVDAGYITNMVMSGVTIDTTGFLNGPLKGLGGGTAAVNTSYGPGYNGIGEVDPPVIINYDLNISKFGKQAWGGATLRDSVLTVSHYDSHGNLLSPYYADGIETPFNGQIVFPMQNWSNGYVNGLDALEHTFSLDIDWMAEQDPHLPSDDSIVPIQGPCPSGDADYDAIQLDILPEIECHRPDGVKLSDYVNTDGKITVSEGASETTFAVNAAGGTVKRTLARQWDHYFDPTDPDFTFDLCRKTKHVTGEDIYGWNTYAYMDLVFRCPVACTVTMAVSAVRYAVLDTYTLPDSERRANYQAIPIDASQEYTFALDALPGEDQTVRVKLLFPDAGGPAYLGRVTAVEFRGFGVGTIILKSQKLISATEESGEHAGEYYPYYVKVSPGPPVQRGKYSFVGISHDGSPVVMLTPDTAYKQHEVLGHGGNLRYCEPLTSSVEGVGPLDYQIDIGTVAGWLNAIEGVEATYNGAASDSALGDGDAEIGPENADWLIPVYPVTADDSLDRRFVPGTPQSLRARPMCRTLGITNGIEWEVKVDHALMFGIEVQAKVGNEPAPEGVAMQAYYMDGEDKIVDALASGVTDQNGYCVVAPIPADESREYDVEQAA